ILATYGELFSITRQAIINDDLQMLSDIPFKLGQAAKATIGDLVYAVLTGNPAMSDGKALFHADHSNLLTGAASALSIDSL
ncbi:TPA: Clp protease ClpP, partial [Pseudomonas aeruginosa]|nr:Clp protease ClpP [Pseudomonas aeruginosa]